MLPAAAPGIAAIAGIPLAPTHGGLLRQASVLPAAAPRRAAIAGIPLAPTLGGLLNNQ